MSVQIKPMRDLSLTLSPLGYACLHALQAKLELLLEISVYLKAVDIICEPGRQIHSQ